MIRKRKGKLRCVDFGEQDKGLRINVELCI